MKNSTLTKFRDYNLVVGENSFKVDFSRAARSQDYESSPKKTSEKESKLPGYLMLVLLFLFTNFLFAQKQPACNLSGLLEARRANDGGPNLIFDSEVAGVVPGTIYKWEFKSNSSGARFVSANGHRKITVNTGNQNGDFNLKLTVTNPSTAGETGRTCSCTKSVSVGNL